MIKVVGHIEKHIGIPVARQKGYSVTLMNNEPVRYSIVGWWIDTDKRGPDHKGSYIDQTKNIINPQQAHNQHQSMNLSAGYTVCGYSMEELMAIRNESRHHPKTIKVIS